MSGPEPAGTIVDGVDIDAVHTAVTGCPGVADVGGSSLAALTTYLPGRRVPGIRINTDTVEVEVVAEWNMNMITIAGGIRRALVSIVGGRRVDITIVDIELPEGDPAAGSLPALEPAPIRPELPAVPIRPPVVIPPESEH